MRWSAAGKQQPGLGRADPARLPRSEGAACTVPDVHRGPLQASGIFERFAGQCFDKEHFLHRMQHSIYKVRAHQQNPTTSPQGKGNTISMLKASGGLLGHVKNVARVVVVCARFSGQAQAAKLGACADMQRFL